MKAFVVLCLILFSSSLGLTQSIPASPQITLGITPLVIGQSTSIQVLVSNPVFSPVPTGQVTIDFGDGSDPDSLTITDTRVEASHVYDKPGQFTIRASYSGDSNFANVTALLTAVSLASTSVYPLHTFGDSLTGGLPSNWPILLTGVLGWPRINSACGGCKTNDQAPFIYNAKVDNTFASTWLLGQNDGAATPAQQLQFQHATMAENAWLAIPEGPAKLRAQSSAMTQSGSWSPSSLFATTGLQSSVSGSALNASVPGSTIYVGLSATPTTDYTAHILIDGIDQGTVSPVSDYPGEYDVPEPYGLRFVVGGDRTAVHTVQIVCTDPGTSGCYVDWIGGNGAAARPNLPPYLWTGVTYHTLQNDSDEIFAIKNGIVRTVEQQLESDGLAIRVADIASLFNGPALPQCVGDGIHPSACGNLIEETVWLSAMTYLATEAQRIDMGQVPSVIVGTPLSLNAATATSGLPVMYSVVSGPGIISQGQLTAQQAGTIVIQASQAGNATVLPSTVQFSVTALSPTSTVLASPASNADLGANVLLKANVTSNGSPVTAGSVTFLNGATTLGVSSLDGNGVASLNTTTLPAGTDALAASYDGTNQFAPSSSTQLSIEIDPPDFRIVPMSPSLSVQHGHGVSTSLVVTPIHGFNQTLALSCAGLPAGASCSFASPTPQPNGTSTIALTINAGGVTDVSIASQVGRPLYTAIPFALVFWLRRQRRTFLYALRTGMLVIAIAVTFAMLSGCSERFRPTAGLVTITAQSQRGIIHATDVTLTIR